MKKFTAADAAEFLLYYLCPDCGRTAFHELHKHYNGGRQCTSQKMIKIKYVKA